MAALQFCYTALRSIEFQYFELLGRRTLLRWPKLAPFCTLAKFRSIRKRPTTNWPQNTLYNKRGKRINCLASTFGFWAIRKESEVNQRHGGLLSNSSTTPISLQWAKHALNNNTGSQPILSLATRTIFSTFPIKHVTHTSSHTLSTLVS